MEPAAGAVGRERARRRVAVFREPGSLRIELSGQRSLPGAVVVAVWLVGWGVGEAMVVRQIFFADGPSAGGWFQALWLAAWTAAGGLALWALARTLSGKEVVLLDCQGLRITRWPGWRGRRYQLGAVRALRLEQGWIPADVAEGYRAGLVALAFEHGERNGEKNGEKTVRIGRGLPEAELELLARAVSERLPVTRGPPPDGPPPPPPRTHEVGPEAG